MKKYLIKQFNLWSYKLGLKLIAQRIIHSTTPLTPEYLKEKGWVLAESLTSPNCWVEPNIKERDAIRVEFQSNYYRVWQGQDRTFIALESSQEWFDAYYLLVNREQRYLLSPL